MSDLDYLDNFEGILKPEPDKIDGRLRGGRKFGALCRKRMAARLENSFAIRLSKSEPSLPKLKFMEGKDE